MPCSHQVRIAVGLRSRVWRSGGLCALILVGLFGLQPRVSAQIPGRALLAVGAGYGAKLMASGLFLQGRERTSVEREELSPETQVDRTLTKLMRFKVDSKERTVSCTVLGFTATAVYRPHLGVALDCGTSVRALRAQDPGEVAPPFDPKVTAWPLGDLEATGELPEKAKASLDQVVSEAFSEKDPAKPTRRTRAVVILHQGKIVAERYGAGISAQTPLHGWSMGKSLVSALVGLLVADGKLKIDDAVACAEWGAKDDPRGTITWRHLLTMTSGLKWDEDLQGAEGDPAVTLFATFDIAANYQARELAAAPGSQFNYSSGSTNFVCWLLRKFHPSLVDYHLWPAKALFHRVGMLNTVLETDPSGTFAGSSYLYASARDFARFGLLYANRGRVLGKRILSESWIDETLRPAAASQQGDYGLHWWLNAGPKGNPAQRPWPDLPADLFRCDGFQGQAVVVIPSKELVIVRLGMTKDWRAWRTKRFVSRVVRALSQ